jgi:hypothetical protein
MVDWYFEILDVLGVISLNDDRCIREHAQDYLESIAGLNYQGAQMEARLDGLPPPPSTQMIEESDIEKQWAFTATKAPAALLVTDVSEDVRAVTTTRQPRQGLRTRQSTRRARMVYPDVTIPSDD